MLEEITSRDNRRIKQLSKILSSKKERDRSLLFVAEGARLCQELVLANKTIQTLYLTREAQEKYSKECRSLCAVAEQTFLIPKQLAEQVADTKSPQGIFAVVPQFIKQQEPAIIEGKKKYLLLEDLQDPGNVGTILRTAFAFGIDGVWLQNCADVYSPKVLRSAMGSVFHLPIYLTDNLSSVIDSMKEKEIVVWAATLTQGAQPLTHDLFAGAGSTILIGNEGAGLTSGRIAECSGAVMIPMAEKAESLNASVAASILLWEMTKKNNGKIKDKG